jgi:hypothetical protein
MHDFVVSSADLFQTSSYSQDVLSAKYDVDLGEDNDAIGSVGGVTYGGKRYTQVCLVSAFRSVGVEVPYTRDGPFWVKHDGNEMLAPYGFEVKEVDQEALGGVGLFVLHSDYHFIGCVVKGSAIYLYGHPVTEVIQRADPVVFNGDFRVFQLFALATGLPAVPWVGSRGTRPTRGKPSAYTSHAASICRRLDATRTPSPGWRRRSESWPGQYIPAGEYDVRRWRFKCTSAAFHT